MENLPLTLKEYFKTKAVKGITILNDGAGETFPLSGVITYGAILFADLPGFSKRLAEYPEPGYGLFLANLFFAWFKGEHVYKFGGLLDKYIGDEIMMVFPADTCDGLPLKAALSAARRFIDYDVWDFRPRVGVAVGDFVIGIVGPLEKDYDDNFRLTDITAVGNTVNIAARCVQTLGNNKTVRVATSDIELVRTVFPSRPSSNGGHIRRDVWNIDGPKEVEAKNVGCITVIDIENPSIWGPLMGFSNGKAKDRETELHEQYTQGINYALDKGTVVNDK